MPFMLKSAGATYQIMMNAVFREKIRETLELYMDDMTVKSNQEDISALHLQRTFKESGNRV